MAPTWGFLNPWSIRERSSWDLFNILDNALSTITLRLLVVLVNTTSKVKVIQYIQANHKRITWTEHYPTMLVSLTPQTMEFWFWFSGLLLSDILLNPLLHCFVRLAVIRVCSTVCLMSQSFWYLQLTVLRHLSLASVIAGPNVQIHVA